VTSRLGTGKTITFFTVLAFHLVSLNSSGHMSVFTDRLKMMARGPLKSRSIAPLDGGHSPPVQRPPLISGPPSRIHESTIFKGIGTIWRLKRRRLIQTIFRLLFACGFVGYRCGLEAWLHWSCIDVIVL
jgi:hypothetical protein